MVKQIESFDEFKALIDGDKPVIVDFWATWCGPCKLIGPHFDKLAGKNENVEFVKVDVDAQEEVAKFAGIKAMPTFIAWKKGERIGDLTGAVPAKLVALVEKISSESA